MTQSTPHDTRATLVVGLGDSGFSVVRFLVRRGVYPVVADSREAPPMVERLRRDFPNVEVHLGPFDAGLFTAFPRVIVSPGVSIAEPALRAAHEGGAEILGDVELFAQLADAPVIAVTGSNGKSTVTALIGELLTAAGIEARVGGNIGIPVLDLVDDDAPDFYVLELSSFQLETTSTLETASAVVLNVTPDHMDRYQDVTAYGRAKARIFDHCVHCVVNRDDARVMSLVPATCDARFSFGLSAPESDDEFGLVEHTGRRWLAQGGKHLLAADTLHLQARHNIGNVLAAFALIHAAGVEITPAMTERARTFAGLPHRMELVADHDGVRWINDSKGTNVGATCAAMQGIDAPIVLIAGGQGKGADFSALAQAAFGRVTHAIVIGTDRKAIGAALELILPVTEADSLVSAVDMAANIACAGDVVLFSPACASFDMFRNFEHRGDVFRALVQEKISCKR